MFSIIFGQVILSICFFLKKAFLVGIISILSIIPTLTFRSVCKDTFEQSYNDAALLQTSELDGWDVNEETSMLERERYRKWLVDCHKASYVPVCVNAEDNFLTSEPAGKEFCIAFLFYVGFSTLFLHLYFQNCSCHSDGARSGY